MNRLPGAARGAHHGPFARLGRWVSARPRAVAVVVALAAAAAGLYGAPVAEHLQAGGLEAPGSESQRTADLLQERLHVGHADLVAVLHSSERDVRDPQYASFVLDGIDRLYGVEGVGQVVSHYDTGIDSLVARDGRRTVLIVALEGSPAEKVAALPEVERSLREIFPGVEIGGHVPSEALAQGIAKQDIQRAELLAIPIAALLALIFFRSAVAALLPIAIGGFALALCVAAIRVLAGFAEISIFALNVCAFLGLGLSIDYALLAVQRFREEIQRGEAVGEAVAITLDTAGRSVFVSGLTVWVSLAVLLLVPLPLVRSVAVGGMFAVSSAVLGALVLLPALLAWLGPRVDRFAIGRGVGDSGPSRAWARIGRLSVRHPWPIAIGCTLVLLVVADPALRMRAAMPDTKTFPADSEVRRVDERLSDPAQFDPSGASAMQIALETDGPVLAPDNVRRVQAYLTAVAAVAGVASVESPLGALDADRVGEDGLVFTTDPDRLTALDRTVDGDLALITVQGSYSFRSNAAGAAVEAVRALPHPGRRLGVGGPTAAMVDVDEVLEAHALQVAVLVVGWNLLVLFWAFRSILVPLKAALMNALSLGASFGVLTWVFQDGNLAGPLGFEPPGGIEPTIPLILVAVIFGLSMDYEVFLLSRIQEEYRRHGDNARSIVEGLAHTGRVISSAALILLVVIGAFAAGQLVYVKEIGVGLASAIALDVTLVRALLVPATMRLLGPWNWWAPRWLGGGTAPDSLPAP